MMQGGYQQHPGTAVVQQPATTVVVVQQPTGWSRRYPPYMRHGIKMSGIVLSFPVVICLGLFGGLFFFAGILVLSFGDYDDDDIFDDDVDSSISAGVFLLIIGSLLIAGCIALACYAKKKYRQHWNTNTDNPGRVINRNPSPSPMHQPINAGQPGGVPPAGTQMPQYPPMAAGMPPAGGYGTAPMGAYPSYPGGQPSAYPPPAAAPYETAPPYTYSPGGEKSYPPHSGMDYSSPGLQVPPTTLPGMALDPNNLSQSEYTAPPAYAPDYKPPY